MYILGILQGIGGILEKNYLYGNPCAKSLSIPGSEKQKEEIVRVGRGMNAERCLRTGANTCTSKDEDKNISNPPLYGVFQFPKCFVDPYTIHRGSEDQYRESLCEGHLANSREP